MPHYSAQPGPIHRLDIASSFNSLTSREKHYAHHMSRAAWAGSRIVLTQVSSEAPLIFDLTLELYRVTSGDWNMLRQICDLSRWDLDLFLEYAATFLSNLGNYYGSGDQKFVPGLPQGSFLKLKRASRKASDLIDDVVDKAYAVPPYSLGFPGRTAQSTYYPGELEISRNEIVAVSKTLEQNNVLPENTRLRKREHSRKVYYEILQASNTLPSKSKSFHVNGLNSDVYVLHGDHAAELEAVCSELEQASDYAANERQEQFLQKYIESFKSGSLGAYRESLRVWVKDVTPRVENIFGFVEPYRDPFGVRAEWEGIVAISDQEETARLQLLVENSAKFIRRLPWAQGSSENDGKGVFEKALFEPPDFTSIHALAYCSSIIFPGINLPNYNDIRQESGFKNVIIANRMSAESSRGGTSPYIDNSEAETFQNHKFATYYLWVVLHELLGHGTGKMMCEDPEGSFNFDRLNPPVDLVTQKPIETWYLPGQTWTGQFEDLATTVDECRAELVGAYLMDDKELLALFGFTDTSDITASDLTYNMYLQLGVDGLTGLQNYNVDADQWGQAHSQAHFATLKWLLRDADKSIHIEADTTRKALTVLVDRSKILSHAKPSLGRMLLRLHMYRCTANVAACREYYEDLSKVDDKYLEWRDIVLAQPRAKWKFVQANTFLKDGEMILKEYDATNEGIIKSWAERDC